MMAGNRTSGHFRIAATAQILWQRLWKRRPLGATGLPVTHVAAKVTPNTLLNANPASNMPS
jgi:hypothetical protein